MKWEKNDSSSRCVNERVCVCMMMMMSDVQEKRPSKKGERKDRR